MRAIAKGAEPQGLAMHRQADPTDYEGYSGKDTLRIALLADQRGLCCYCMNRIRNEHNNMKVEHWRSQEGFPNERLRYANLLGACRGGEGQPPNLQHCDTRKGSSSLLWNPADPAHQIEARIWYESDGTIKSDDAAFDLELNNVLNLNLPVMKNNRKGVLDGILQWWNREKSRIQGPVPRARLLRERDKRVTGTGELAPYCQVAWWWLTQRLAKTTV